MVSDDRGQLLLVAGVLLALVIVASAVLLNGIVAPGTSGTRGLGNELDSFGGDVDPIKSDLEGLFEETTSRDAHGEALPYAASSALGDNNKSYGRVLASTTASERGSVVNVEYLPGGSLSGRVVFQRPDDSRNFTNNSFAGDWKLATGTESIPRAQFNVSERDASPTDPDLPEINVTSTSGDQVRLLFADTEVQIDDGTAGSPRVLCAGLDADDDVHVEMRKPQDRTTVVYGVNTTGRHRCGTFELGDHVDPPYDVGIVNGGNVSGTYAVGLHAPDTLADTSGTWPDSASGVVNPRFRVTYLSDGITYESSFALYNRTEP